MGRIKEKQIEGYTDPWITEQRNLLIEINNSICDVGDKLSGFLLIYERFENSMKDLTSAIRESKTVM